MTSDKKMFMLLATLICAIMMFISGCGQNAAVETSKEAYTITDDSGTKVAFKGEPKKILTLAMGLDSIALGLNPNNNLVGINSLADDPASSNIVEYGKKIKTKIKNPTAEEILALQPDVVFINDWGKPEIVHNLRDLGIKVVVVKGAKSVADVKDNIHLMAETLQQKGRGELLIAQMDERLEIIKEKLLSVPKDKRKKVVLVSLMTSYGGIGCSFDDMCKYAGVENGLATVGLHNGQQLTKEMLVKIDPDVLIMPVYNDHGKFDIKKYNDEFLNDPSLQTMKAIKNKQLFYPHESYIYNTSQDIVFGVQEIARAAYGDELFAITDREHLEVK